MRNNTSCQQIGQQTTRSLNQSSPALQQILHSQPSLTFEFLYSASGIANLHEDPSCDTCQHENPAVYHDTTDNLKSPSSWWSNPQWGSLYLASELSQMAVHWLATAADDLIIFLQGKSMRCRVLLFLSVYRVKADETCKSVRAVRISFQDFVSTFSNFFLYHRYRVYRYERKYMDTIDPTS